MTDGTEDELEILEALAKIKDIKTFRLGKFMQEHGMNPSQPANFYGALLKACRNNEFLIRHIDREAANDSKRIAQLKIDASAKDSEVSRLKSKVNRLLVRIELKGEGVDKEAQELKAITSQLQEKVNEVEQERDMALAKIEELQAEIVELQAKNVELEKLNKVVGELYYGLRQQGWVDTPPGETEEPQENNYEAPTEGDITEYLQGLEDKRRNETERGEG